MSAPILYSVDRVDQLPLTTVIESINSVTPYTASDNEFFDKYTLLFVLQQLNQLNFEGIQLLRTGDIFKSFYIAPIDQLTTYIQQLNLDPNLPHATLVKQLVNRYLASQLPAFNSNDLNIVYEYARLNQNQPILYALTAHTVDLNAIANVIARSGNLPLMKILVDRYKIPLSEALLTNAARSGSQPLVSWLINHHRNRIFDEQGYHTLLVPTTELIAVAEETGSQDLVQWLRRWLELQAQMSSTVADIWKTLPERKPIARLRIAQHGAGITYDRLDFIDDYQLLELNPFERLTNATLDRAYYNTLNRYADAKEDLTQHIKDAYFRLSKLTVG